MTGSTDPDGFKGLTECKLTCGPCSRLWPKPNEGYIQPIRLTFSLFFFYLLIDVTNVWSKNLYLFSMGSCSNSGVVRKFDPNTVEIEMLDENSGTFEYLNRTLIDHLKFLTSEFDLQIEPKYPKVKREDNDDDLQIKIKVNIGMKALHIFIYSLHLKIQYKLIIY